MKSNLKKMFAVTIVLSVLSFGFTAHSVDSAETQSKEEVKLAAALKGCVILEDGESGLIYRYKCERCGHVQPGSVIMASSRVQLLWPDVYQKVSGFKNISDA